MSDNPDFSIASAAGWIELGEPAEALKELNRLSPNDACKLEVLKLRFLAFAMGQHWGHAGMVAQVARDLHPNNPNPVLWSAEALFKRTGSAAHAHAALARDAQAFQNVPEISEALKLYEKAVHADVEARP